jgi:hypothetical protein
MRSEDLVADACRLVHRECAQGAEHRVPASADTAAVLSGSSCGLATVCRVYHVVVALAKDVAVSLVQWLRRVDSVTPLGGGWNSSTWLVAAGDERYVAKLVDHLDAQGLGAGHAQEMPEIGPELAHLGRLEQARWVAQAIYFASRIERGIDRGHGTPNANQEGLATAYEGMTAGSGYRA